jgi:hypothetical protein
MFVAQRNTNANRYGRVAKLIFVPMSDKKLCNTIRSETLAGALLRCEAAWPGEGLA